MDGCTTHESGMWGGGAFEGSQRNMDSCTTHESGMGGGHLKDLKETWTVVPHMNQVCGEGGFEGS